MARKPNYRFDRMEKDRAKAAKKAERLKARQERSEKRGQDVETLEEVSTDESTLNEASTDEASTDETKAAVPQSQPVGE